MSLHTLDIALYRGQVPFFANPTTYPDAQVQAAWATATAYLNANDNCGINGQQLQVALNWMTAHLMYSNVLIAQGQTTVGVQTGASIDKVSVSYQAPPMLNNWRAWLLTTPYGQQFLALMEIAAAGGFYIGGSPERYGFRKVGGVF